MEAKPEKSILEWLREKLSDPRAWFKRAQTQASVPTEERAVPVDSSEAVRADTSNHPMESSALASIEAEDDSVDPTEPASHQTYTLVTQENGPVAHVTINADIPIGTTLTVSLRAEANGKVSVINQPIVKTASQKAKPVPNINWDFSWLTSLRQGVVTQAKNFAARPERILAAAAALIYLFIISNRLTDFPIYFFGDEAIQAVFAGRLIKNHWIAVNSLNVPIYVEAAGNRWTPLVSMYFQGLTMLLFGKSIVVTRLTTGVIGMLGAVAAALILKLIFKKPIWWSGMLFMLIMPAWFLHSRTAFETVMATGFYGVFLLFYLLYRTRSPKYLFGAVIFGALVFYSYSNSQAVILAAAGLLFLNDLRYHWDNRKTILQALLLLLVLAIPFIIFRIKEPDAIALHLRAVNSYLAQDIPLTEKIQTYFGKYLYGLSPRYWAFANTRDLIRHRMDDLAQIPLWIYALITLGSLLALRYVRDPAYRVIILAALAAPAGAAALDISITRVLSFVVPASILAVLGLDWLREKIAGRIQLWVFSVVLFCVLSLSSLNLLSTALTNGPFWTNDYGLYGLQFGAKQIFQDTIPEYLMSDPENQVYISSTWANGADNFIYYFIKSADWPRVKMFGVEGLINDQAKLSNKDYFVATTPEYQKLVDSKLFKEIQVEKIINYPTGQPGFYVVHLVYVDNIDKIIAAQKAAARVPLNGTVEIDGQTVNVTYSRPDAGQLKDMFDGDFFTLLRGAEANPFELDFTFPSARTISGFAGDFATMDYLITFDLYPADGGDPVHYETTQTGLTKDAHIEITFDHGPTNVIRLRMSIKNLKSGDTANIHLRELKFLP